MTRSKISKVGNAITSQGTTLFFNAATSAFSIISAIMSIKAATKAASTTPESPSTPSIQEFLNSTLTSSNKTFTPTLTPTQYLNISEVFNNTQIVDFLNSTQLLKEAEAEPNFAAKKELFGMHVALVTAVAGIIGFYQSHKSYEAADKEVAITTEKLTQLKNSLDKIKQKTDEFVNKHPELQNITLGGSFPELCSEISKHLQNKPKQYFTTSNVVRGLNSFLLFGTIGLTLINGYFAIATENTEDANLKLGTTFTKEAAAISLAVTAFASGILSMVSSNIYDRILTNHKNTANEKLDESITVATDALKTLAQGVTEILQNSSEIAADKKEEIITSLKGILKDTNEEFKEQSTNTNVAFSAIESLSEFQSQETQNLNVELAKLKPHPLVGSVERNKIFQKQQNLNNKVPSPTPRNSKNFGDRMDSAESSTNNSPTEHIQKPRGQRISGNANYTKLTNHNDDSLEI